MTGEADVNPKQEPKYNASVDGRIVNRATGEAIPDDEPVFIFRARDRHATAVLLFYMEQIADGDADHAKAVHARIWDFIEFRNKHPERMKEPDTEPQP